MPNALEGGHHCDGRTEHDNPYCKPSRRSGKNEEYRHQRRSAALSTYCSFAIAKAFFNKTTNAWCEFSNSNFDILTRAYLFLRIVLEMPYMSTGLPAVKGLILQSPQPPKRALWQGLCIFPDRGGCDFWFYLHLS